MGEAPISIEELQLATRNHGMPLEALRYPVTPVGLHYLLIHYDIPAIDAATWRLRVDGSVDRPLELSLDDLRSLPATTRALTMECAGNGRAQLDPRPASQPWLVEAVGTGEWTGVELAHVLDAAGARPEAVEWLFTGADRGVEAGVVQSYQRSLPVTAHASGDSGNPGDSSDWAGALLAYELNGAPLPAQHGFPLRLVVPGWYGMTNVKWLTSITALDTPFDGYQQAWAYRLRQHEDEAGEAVTRMVPRALMVPPGIPDFFTRARTVEPGPCTITGRAWSGHAAIATVEVSTDGGTSWAEATLDGPSQAGTWVGWHHQWTATAGRHQLCCRATDASGRTQPTDAPWNLGGYSNNTPHTVPVTVAATTAATATTAGNTPTTVGEG